MDDRAVALKKDGFCDADIIKALGAHKSTFYRWLKEGEDPKTAEERAGKLFGFCASGGPNFH